MTAKTVSLKFDQGKARFIDSFSLIINQKSLSLSVYLNSEYGNKRAVSSVSTTNWNRTRKLLREALGSKGVKKDHIDLVLDILDDNSDVILGNISGATSSGAAADTGGTEAAEQAMEEEERHKITENIRSLREENKNITYEAWRIELAKRWNTLHDLIIRHYPDLWEPLKFVLVVRTVLDVDDISIPFTGLILGPPGSSKSAALVMLKNLPQIIFTDHFTPPALVSHNASVSREQLEKNDLLPRIRNRCLLTPEMGPTFTERDEILSHWCGIISRVADGGGYRSDSGVYAQRGYSGEYMFAWLGASIELPYRAYKHLATTGFKLYFLRLRPKRKSRVQRIDHVLKSRKHKMNTEEIRTTVTSYFCWFKICPLRKRIDESGKESAAICRIPWNFETDESKEGREIIGICTDLGELLRSLRGYVETYKRSSEDADYPTTDVTTSEQEQKKHIRSTEFENDAPILEEPDRANWQLYNLARAHALTTEGRDWLVKEKDLPMVIRVALSTCTYARAKVFRLLVENDGTATTSQIADCMHSSNHKAKRTMVELRACGLVTMERVNPLVSNSEYEITLKQKFDWVLKDEFKQLIESSENTNNDEEDESETDEDDE
jgi:predicted transcriptional regulator